MTENTAGTGIPAHIGIIMDGNGRWAQRNRLPRSSGHARGAEVFRRITRHCESIGVKALTVFAFSTENWKRDRSEVESIMNLLRRYLKDAFGFKKDNIRIHFIGERERLAPDIVELMQEIEEFSKENTGLILNVAINYGGRDEIVSVARTLASMAARGELQPEDITEQLCDSMTCTADSPPLDMILRPSGEQRISNFLLWQCAYSEFVYMDTLWPDFTPELLDRAIEEYGRRSRRFGGR